MQREGVNTQDVRNKFCARSIRWKIEKRLLDRMDLVMRMKGKGITKSATLGWFGKLKGWEKAPGKKRKTVQ